MAAPTEGVPRKVTEMEPPAVFIRHLVWGPLVFHAGMTNDELPTLKEQCAEILPRAGARLKENGCDWHNVVRVSFMLHKSEKPQSVLDIASAIVPVPLENAEIELVEGYSTPGKLVEIEVTARRQEQHLESGDNAAGYGGPRAGPRPRRGRRARHGGGPASP